MYLEQKIETLEKKYSELSDKILKIQEENKLLKTEKLYSTKDAASLLGVSRSTLLFHIRNGTIKATRGSSTKYARCKVSQTEIELYIEHRDKNFKQ